MKDHNRFVLELFVEKADELAEEDFTKFLEKFGQHLSYEFATNSQQITMGIVAPTQTMHKSFLLTYRMFIQRNDGLGFIDPHQKISSQLLDSSLSPEWLAQVRDVAQKIHAFLLEKPTGQFEFHLIDPQGNTRTEILTRWDILETLLYGDYAHASQRERLKNWLSTPFAPMVIEFLMMEFREILIKTLGGILCLAQHARSELAITK